MSMLRGPHLPSDLGHGLAGAISLTYPGLVYSVDSRESLDGLLKWVRFTQNAADPPLVVAGNKTDLSGRFISEGEGRQFAESVRPHSSKRACSRAGISRKWSRRSSQSPLMTPRTLRRRSQCRRAGGVGRFLCGSERS
jgi:hypothetical protein